MFIKLFKYVFGVTHKERLERAIYERAKAAAITEHYRIEANTYAMLLTRVDCESQWWQYAELKQHLEDALHNHRAACEWMRVAEGRFQEVQDETSDPQAAS